MKRAAALVAVALLSACSTHPITGRDQVLALPLVQAAHAEVGYALYTGAQGLAAVLPCTSDCRSVAAGSAFARRVEAVVGRLEPAVREMSPDLFERIGAFRIEVSDALGVGTASSPRGRIAFGAGLAALEPTDTVLEFLVAREMAHVIARHAEENSGASLAVSALGLLLPGIRAIARLFATTLGSGALKASWAEDQRREADEIAVALLGRAGVTAPSIARGLGSGVRRSRMPDGDWGARYVESTQRVALIAASRLP